jgi:hypothetical protein
MPLYVATLGARFRLLPSCDPWVSVLHTTLWKVDALSKAIAVPTKCVAVLLCSVV